MAKDKKVIPEEDGSLDGGHGRKKNQRLKPYLVLQILMQHTDEDHVMSADQIAAELDVSVEFLTDDSKSLILDSKERFIFNSTSDSNSIREAAEYLEKGKQIFECNDISQEDKQALFACLTEMYFNAAKTDN